MHFSEKGIIFSLYLSSCKHRALVIEFPIIEAQKWCALTEEQSSGGEDEASL